MKRILLGGLSPEFEHQVTQAFQPHRSEYETWALASSRELDAQLASQRGELLILDLDAKDGGGFALLAMVAERRASIPIVGVGQASRPDLPAYEETFPGRYFPLVKYLQKPISAEALFDAAESELRQATWGVIQGLSLTSLLQMLNLERKTCTIKVSSHRRQGFFYLKEGEVINAKYRRHEGMEAVQRLINAESPKVEIDGTLHDATQLIHLRMDEMLMNAAQWQDETLGGSQPSFEGAPPTGGGDEGFGVPSTEIGKWGGEPQALPAPPTAPAAKYRKGGLALLVAGLLLALAAAYHFYPTQRALAVQSTPEGAEVSLDGVLQGTTPMTLKVPDPPSGLLSVRRAGYLPEAHPLVKGEHLVTFELKAAQAPKHAATAPPAPEPERKVEHPAQGKRSAKPAPKPPAQASPRNDIFDQLRN